PAAAVMNHDPERLPQGDTEHGGLVVAYLDDVIAGQPPDRLAWADPPAASDLAAFVHTGGTTGAPKIAAQVPVDADISSLRLPIVGASPLPATVREAFATHTGRRLLEGYGLTEATCAWPSAGPRCSRATSATRTPAARG
ncbi:MAG: AMP-binding protein, partial [Micromonosporaceae bacterium]